MDIVSPERRSQLMAGVRSRDTKPEMVVRRFLHSKGLRFRVHRKDLPGRPDIVLPGRKAVIFVHGCFWHGHDCPKAKLPQTRREFWAEKIATNRDRDDRVTAELGALGWRVITLWGCELSLSRLEAVVSTLSPRP